MPTWNDFARLEGAALTPELVCEQLVGDRVFPGLELGQTDRGFDSELLDEEHPATHELTIDEKSIEYRLHCWATSSDEETRKVRAKAIYNALATAVAKLHGKVKGKAKRWELGDRDIVLTMGSLSSGRPSSTVTIYLTTSVS